MFVCCLCFVLGGCYVAFLFFSEGFIMFNVCVVALLLLLLLFFFYVCVLFVCFWLVVFVLLHMFVGGAFSWLYRFPENGLMCWLF